MNALTLAALLAGIAGAPAPTTQPTDNTETKKAEELMSADTFAGLKLRCVGPAMSSGRVGDFAVDPKNRAHYYVAVASGGVWKTDNGGTTFTPVFDDQGSFSIGCVTMDPHNPNVVWVGTGENNSQRSVDFGDGVYRSLDGGAHWENMGLRASEHIGMIAIDPRDSDVVYVAAQGPLWKAGGDRGLYKTTNGGRSWRRILFISDDTGVNDIHLDPRDPDTMYATAYQRRRHVWTLIDGGPESAIYKSTDGGESWRKVEHGLPEVDMGRIGIDISPVNPDVVYAIVEAADGKSGFFRSRDRGETWEHRCDYSTTSPQYYNEIVCDPNDVDRVYALDTVLRVTEDGGKSFKRMPREGRHVDDHALWIDPADSDYLLVGCDGGVYESFDKGKNWRFMPNLPVTQFYRVSVDDSTPFYFVYGGTQDNNSMGGPSNTTSPAGIVNEDWFVTVSGDGFKTQVDPVDPNIVYSQWQYGGLVRYDRRNGQIVDIKPREAPDDQPYRWNWDSPLLVSPHDHQRLYFAGNRVFRSDDQGNSWRAISGDLTRQVDRNALKVMGRIQSVDAVEKHKSTSIYGNIVALSESPLIEGLIYAGTDDGLMQVTEDGGKNWRAVSSFPGVPENTYVSFLLASQHDGDTVYAAFENHKNGDFKPYLLRSTDRGQTWGSVAGDLPDRDFVWCVAEDHLKPDLLFAGTEFGAYFTIDGGKKWIKLKGGMPTISVRDIAIHKGENDLVLGTFGRGIYILDDYSPLRQISEEMLKRDAALLPVANALRYVETSRLGGNSGKGAQGASYYASPNQPFGAVFTYYLKDKILTRKEQRQKDEKEARKAEKTPPYPTIEELRSEDQEQEPQVLLIVRDESGAIVRRVKGSRDKGFHRVSWDLRQPSTTPIDLDEEEDRMPWDRPPAGYLALPGTYSVTLAKVVDGDVVALEGPQPFNVVSFDLVAATNQDRQETVAFEQKFARLRGAVLGAIKRTDEINERLKYMRAAFIETPPVDRSMLEELRKLQLRVDDIRTHLVGDKTRSKHEEPAPPSIRERVETVVESQWYSTSPPTQTHRDAYRYAGTAFTQTLSDLRGVVDDLVKLEKRMDEEGAPWTPGRLPTWQME